MDALYEIYEDTTQWKDALMDTLYEIVEDVADLPPEAARDESSPDLARFLAALMGGSVAPLHLQVFTLPDATPAWFQAPADAAEYINSRSGQNVYAGVGLHPEPSDLGPTERGGAERIKGLFGLWADIDIAGEAHKGSYPPDWESALALARYDLEPTLVVDSGHGLQAWWLFPRPWFFGEGGTAGADERKAGERLAKAWNQRLQALAREKGWKIDSTHDLSRVMRVPGTLNLKREPRPVRLVSDHGPRYRREELEVILGMSDTSEPRPEEPVTENLILGEDREPPREKFDQLLKDPRIAQTFKRERDDLDDASPSGYDLALASFAVMAGWADQEIADLLIFCRSQHGDDLKLQGGYYSRTIAKARQNREPSADGKGKGKRVMVVCKMSDIEAREVDYLWDSRLARGKLSLLAGDPGQGKTAMAIHAASILSRGGVWPDGSNAPQGNTLYYTAEDGIADTLVPRLLAAGGDSNRVKALRVETDGFDVGLQLKQDVDGLETVIREQGIDLLVIDPLNAVCSGFDSHRSADVRETLAPVARMAERARVAVLLVGHLNKGQGSPIQRIQGSMDYVAACRIVLGVATDPDDDNRHLLLPVKQNLSAPSLGLAFRVANPGVVEWDSGPILYSTWEAFSPTTAPRSKAQEAQAFLLDALRDGRRPMKDLVAEAALQGLSETHLREAKKHLGVLDKQDYIKGARGAGASYWYFPGQAGE